MIFLAGIISDILRLSATRATENFLFLSIKLTPASIFPVRFSCQHLVSSVTHPKMRYKLVSINSNKQLVLKQSQSHFRHNLIVGSSPG